MTRRPQRMQWRPSEAQGILGFGHKIAGIVFIAAQQRKQRPSVIFGRLGAGGLDDRREQVDRSNQPVDARSLVLRSRQLHYQRYMQCRVVKQDPMGLFAMLSQAFTMIAGSDHERVLVPTAGSEKVEELSEHGVGVSDLTVVFSPPILRRKRFGRFI